MASANIDALNIELAALKESLRIKLQSLANINPNYQMNAAYIAKLKAEVAVLNQNIATLQAQITAASTPPVQPAPKPNPPVVENKTPEPTTNPDANNTTTNNETIENQDPATVGNVWPS